MARMKISKDLIIVGLIIILTLDVAFILELPLFQVSFIAILFLANWLFSTFIHECGHFIACRIFKYPVKEFIIGNYRSNEYYSCKFFSTRFSLRRNMFLSGRVEWDFKHVNKWHVAIVAAAGPLASIILLLLEVGSILYFYGSHVMIIFAFPMLPIVTSILYNLYPKDNSDGYHIYHSLKKIYQL